MSRMIVALAVCTMLLGMSTGAHALLMTTTLGNDSPGFNDGDTPTTPVLGAAQSGQPAPFNAGIGNDLFSNFSAGWTFNYGALVDPILSASITFGIADHDSAASGSQLSSFTVDGTALTSSLDTLFEAVGEGADGQYDVYTLSLSNSMFADLADGSVTAQLDLQGPGLVTNLLLGGVEERDFNGAHLIFSTLTIETRDAQPVPEPATSGLFVFGLAAVLWYRRRLGVGLRQR